MRCLNCHEDGLPLDTEICPSCKVHIPSLMRDVLPPGTKLRAGTYQIDYALGRGGFGVTYRAHHTLLEKLVAIKEFYPQSCALRNQTTGGFAIPTNQEDVFRRGKERFLREGRILARLNHPHVVRVSDLFEENDTAYLVMELVRGRSLRAELDSQPQRRLSPERVEEITGQLVGALAAVHQQGVFHLDIKPDNILLAPEGRSVLVDFGSAKQTVGTRMGKSSTRSFTEGYAAPEVIGGGDVGVESDIFELGMLVWEMLQGELPPNALLRLMGNAWKPEGLPSPWGELLEAALVLPPDGRPKDIEKWWKMVSGRSDNPSVKSAFNTAAPPTTHPLNPLQNPLPTFEFETVTVNARGEITNRQQQRAEFFTEDLGGGVELEMVSIPGGSFMMGSPESEEGRYDTESPQHRVKVPPFFLGKHPVTQKQYQAVMGKNPSGFKGANRPVEEVSWKDATEFCRRLSQKTKKIYRLPSEAQWEYACRAGTTTAFYFGPTITAELANYCGTSTYASAPKGVYREETTDVGSFPPNAFGLFDMHGNVWEWCQDLWHDDYNGAPTDGSAWESGGKSSRRLLRGGSWFNSPRNCRCAYRDWLDAGLRYGNCGFRVVLVPGL